jgi:hypothetical protein
MSLPELPRPFARPAPLDIIDDRARFIPMHARDPGAERGYWVIIDRLTGLALTARGSRRVRKFEEGVRARHQCDRLNKLPRP